LLICIIYLFTTSHDVHAVIARAASNPLYRSNGQGIAFVAWYEGGAQQLEKYIGAADEAGIKLNIFVPTGWLAENQNTVEKTIAGGHICGIYGEDYEKSIKSSELLEQLTRDKSGFISVLDKPVFFMPNNGEYNKKLSNTASELDMRMILWSKDSRAYVARDAEAFAMQVVGNADKGDFILVRLDSRFIGALPMIVNKLQDRNLAVFSLHDLLNNRQDI
jgi:peptidoglycan/xylan/chitin deacetylase (PgdA/CDA1 family)